MISADGWRAVQDGKPNTDLIPTELVVARYFAKERKAIDNLEGERDALTREMEELAEEHGAEDGLLFEAQNEKGKLTKASVKARLAAALEGGADVAAPGEVDMLRRYLSLIDEEAAAGRKVKDAEKALDAKVTARYAQLMPEDIKQLVVHDKWLATLAADVQSELDRVSQALAGRVKQLAERYATPVPQLVAEVEALSAKVDEHLKRMGFAW
jgi:type I restriction enzyme M protein